MRLFVQASCSRMTLTSVCETRGPSSRPLIGSVVGGGVHGLGWTRKFSSFVRRVIVEGNSDWNQPSSGLLELRTILLLPIFSSLRLCSSPIAAGSRVNLLLPIISSIFSSEADLRRVREVRAWISKRALGKLESAPHHTNNIPGQKVLSGIDGEFLLDHIPTDSPHPDPRLAPAKLPSTSTKCLSRSRCIKRWASK